MAAEAVAIWRGALERTRASDLVRAALAADPQPSGPMRLLALGKAALPMAEAAIATLGDRFQEALCVCPTGAGRALARAHVVEGSHPRPNRGSLAAGAAIRAFAGSGRGTAVLALLSGGGSALAIAPPAGISFEEKIAATDLLMRNGATIQELNALRKHLSELKGGQLGAMLFPDPVRVLVLSDVPGDDLSTIASGPFAADPTTFADVLRFVAQRSTALPAKVAARLQAGARGQLPETPKPGDPRLAAIVHRVLAGPVDLARAAADAARTLGFDAEADPAPLTGDVATVAARLGRWARANAGRGRRLLALGGEPTLAIPATARAPDGGRAQHLALLAARGVAGIPAVVLAAGSDGRDGPTEQAGAVVDGQTAAAAAAAGIDLDAALADARSGPACRALGAAIARADTGTHLCDLVLVAVR